TTQLAIRNLWWWALLVFLVPSFLITIWLYRFIRSISIQQAQLQQQFQQASHQLQQTKALNSLLLQHIGQGVIGVAIDGRIIFTNPAAENSIGFTSEEMVGKKMHRLIHHHYRNGQFYPEKCPLYLTLKDGITRHLTDEIF